MVRRHFAPLLDSTFAPILANHYPAGVQLVVNGASVTAEAERGDRAPLAVRVGRQRKPSATGYVLRCDTPLPDDRRGVAVSTLGKVIKRGWDWLGLSPAAAARVTGLIEAPALASALTLTKGDLLRTGRAGMLYLAYRKVLQEAVGARPSRRPRWQHVDVSHRDSLAMAGERTYVSNMSPSGVMTAEELLHTHIPDKHVELVRGVLVVREPSGLRHGRVAVELAAQLVGHVRANGLGQVYVESGFKLASDPDTVRGPDLAFISRTRLPDPEPVGYPDLAPDLVVEVLSPGDRPGEVLAKVADWLNAGTRLVWIVDPERRLARVYRQDGRVTLVSANEALDGEDVVPGFSCPLAFIL